MLDYLLQNYLDLPSYLSNSELDTIYLVSSKYRKYIPERIWKERVMQKLDVKEIIFYPNHLNLIHTDLHKTTIALPKETYDIYRYLLRN